MSHLRVSPALPFAKARIRTDFTDDVVVLVGSEQKRFVAHKKVISKSSAFFRSACSGEWKEAKEGEVALPDQEPAIFAIFLHWVYTGELDAWEDEEKDVRMTKANGQVVIPDPDPAIDRCFQCFILGDALLSVSFCNAVVDEFFALCKDVLPSPASICDHWDALPPKSGLGRLCVDMWATGDADDDETYLDTILPELPTGFVLELAKAGIRESKVSVNKRSVWNRGKCYYHKHVEMMDKCV